MWKNKHDWTAKVKLTKTFSVSGQNVHDYCWDLPFAHSSLQYVTPHNDVKYCCCFVVVVVVELLLLFFKAQLGKCIFVSCLSVSVWKEEMLTSNTDYNYTTHGSTSQSLH